MLEHKQLAGLFGLNRALLVVMTMLTLLVPAYSQQEIDPTWYDPWPASSKAKVQHPQQKQKATRENQAQTHLAAGARHSKAELREQATGDLKRPKELAAKK